MGGAPDPSAMGDRSSQPAGAIRTKRVYDDPEPDDGFRVLVDRLWPRGVTKAEAAIDDWMKEITPSNELRRWYHDQRGGAAHAGSKAGHVHDGADDDHGDRPSAGARSEFESRFRAELASREARQALDALAERARAGTVTLVSAVREIEGSHVPVIADELRARLR